MLYFITNIYIYIELKCIYTCICTLCLLHFPFGWKPLGTSRCVPAKHSPSLLAGHLIVLRRLLHDGLGTDIGGHGEDHHLGPVETRSMQIEGRRAESSPSLVWQVVLCQLYTSRYAGVYIVGMCACALHGQSQGSFQDCFWRKRAGRRIIVRTCRPWRCTPMENALTHG